jgi:hypothetical protein
MVSYSTSAHWGLSMGKQDRVEDEPVLTDEAAAKPAASGTEIVPKMALASIIGPPVETPRIAASYVEALPIGMDEMTTVSAAKIDLDSIEAPQIAPEMVEFKPSASESAPEPPVPPSEGAPAPRVNRFAMLAACLALAAAFGGMTGALGAYGLVRPQPARIAAGELGTEEIQALKENVVQARVELAALKASLDAGNRNATTQLAKVGERIDRIERNAAEPAARINKAVENLERISRAEGITRLGDLTGSIASAQPAPGKPGGLDAWVLRDVRHGTAFIEGRAGMMEVEQGDLVPGLGRIDAIRKQDGHWVVVTSRGTISMR